MEDRGSLNANLKLPRGALAQHLQVQGDGEALGLRLSSISAGSEIVLGKVPFSLAHGIPNPEPRVIDVTSTVNDYPLQVGPVSLVLGRPVPLQAHAALSLSGYQPAIHGDAGLKKLLQSTRMLGIASQTLPAYG